MLLRQQPARSRARTCGCQRRCRPGTAPCAPHVIHRDQPPQRGVDAAQVPEVGVAAQRVDVLRDLPVGAPAARPARRGWPPRRARAPSTPLPAHRQHADRGVAAEDARVAARLGGLARRGRQDALRRQVALAAGAATRCGRSRPAAGRRSRRETSSAGGRDLDQDLVGLDHAELAARLLLDHLEAFLQVDAPRRRAARCARAPRSLASRCCRAAAIRRSITCGTPPLAEPELGLHQRPAATSESDGDERSTEGREVQRRL